MFQGLNTALTGLYAQRQALETTGNNISNANTEGYTRQRVDMQSISSSITPSFWSVANKVGLGVTIKDVTRIRDAFLESRSLQEHSSQGKLLRSQDTMATIELSFGEPGDNGLQAQLSEFWSAWDDVANNPGKPATRSGVIEQAKTLVAGFQQAASDLEDLAASSLDKLKSDVKAINAMAQNIADLNSAIQSAVNVGSSPNALLDQRDLLVNKMSDLANITVQNTDSGSVAISIGGVPIVRDNRVTPMQVDDTGASVVLRWDADGSAATVTDGTIATVTSGDMGGLMESILTTIPKYQAMLDSVANALITAVNTQHASGLDQNGNPGGAFFTGTSAATIAVAAPVLGDPSLIAAAGAGGGELDQENARAMAALADSSTGPDVEYREMINVLGVEAQRVNRQVDIQEGIVEAIDGARLSVSGVNLDEEMTNMIKFQRAYDASAKYLNALNEALASLLSII